MRVGVFLVFRTVGVRSGLRIFIKRYTSGSRRSVEPDGAVPVGRPAAADE